MTGDSWIVHGTEVIGADGAGAYMGKYLQKQFFNEERQEVLGMLRRWSSSRGWPASDKLCLSHTLKPERLRWMKRYFTPGHVDEELLGGPAWLLDRSGEDIVKAKVAKLAANKLIRKIGGFGHD